MKEAPERIFATVNGASTQLPSGKQQLVGEWSEHPEFPKHVEYIRADASPKLEITRPETIRQYIDALAAHAVTLPITATAEGAIDAAGKDVFTVDVNGERSDAQVAWISGLVVVAVNTCGGFKAQQTGTTPAPSSSGLTRGSTTDATATEARDHG